MMKKVAGIIPAKGLTSPPVVDAARGILPPLIETTGVPTSLLLCA